MVSYQFSLTQAVKQGSARQKAERLQEALKSVPQVDCPVRWYFADKMVAREIHIPAGTVIVGAVHRIQNMANLSHGRLLIATDGEAKEICAPFQMLIEPGTKTAVTAIEDCVWTNYLPNPTNETDLDKLVEMFTESKACELLGGSQNAQLLANKSLELEA